jgi:TolA-binding protein
MFRRLCVWILIASPLPALAASKEYLELTRDLARLEELVKNLQKSQDQLLQSQNEKFAGMQVLVQQSLGAANSADKSVGIILNNLQQAMRDQEGKLLPPVAALSTRMDSMASGLQTLQTAVSDLTNVIGKMQDRLNDINNAMKVLAAPPAAPPGPAGGTPPGAAALGPPPLSATDMLADANRDRLASNFEVALGGYSNYLKYYADSPQASDAQFYIGLVHYQQKDYEAASKNFDAVVERYDSADKRVPEALYYKGLSLAELPGHGTAAAGAFRDLVTQYPKDTRAKAACDKLVKLGYNCPAPKAPAKPPAKTSRKSK